MKRVSVIAITVLLLLAIPSGVALADRIVTEDDTPPEELVIWGDNAVIEEGGVVDGDVVIFGGNVDIFGEVTGDVVVFGGNVLVDGELDGDVIVFGGNLATGENADVEGECVRIGGNISGDNNLNCLTETDINLPPFLAGLVGQMGPTEMPEIPAPPEMPDMPELPEVPEIPEVSAPNIRIENSGPGFFGLFAQSVGTSILMALLAYGAASLMPLQMRRMEDAVRVKPISTSVFGFLTGMTGVIALGIFGLITAVLVFVLIGLLLIPVWFVLLLGLLAAGVLGWTVMGKLTADFLAPRFRFMQRSDAGRAALGTAVLSLTLGFLGALPGVFGAGLVTWLVVSAGLGAVALTKFGTREYFPAVAGSDYETEYVPEPDPEKVTAVLETLPDND